MVTRRLFISTAAGAAAFARAWEKDAFPGWSDSFVDKILTDSPWAKQVTAPFRFRPATGGTAGGVGTEIYLTVRWSSALPVRQALTLSQWGQEGLRDPKVKQALERSEDEYVVEVAGFPVNMISQGVRRFEAELAGSSALVVKGRRPLAPAAVSVPDHGNHLIATLRFPRFQNLSESEGFIELMAEAGPMRFAQKFRLREMVYHGRLEL